MGPRERASNLAASVAPLLLAGPGLGGLLLVTTLSMRGSTVPIEAVLALGTFAFVFGFVATRLMLEGLEHLR